MNKITVEITNPITLEKLNTLSAEFTLSIEILVNLGVERLIKDVEFVRNLRIEEKKK